MNPNGCVAQVNAASPRKVHAKRHKKNYINPNIDFVDYIKRGTIAIDDVVGSDKETFMATIIDRIHHYAIKKTPDGRYMTYVPDETKPNGRRQIKKKSKADLYRFLLAFYDVSEKADKKGTTPFKELFEEWTEYKRNYVNVSNPKKGLSPSTIRRYERDFEKYLAGSDLAGKPICEITSVYLEKAMREIIEKHSIPERSAGNLIGYIRQAFQYARRAEYILKDPAELVDRDLLLASCKFVPPKADNERVLSLEELMKLQDAVWAHEARHPSYMPDYAIELAILTGMRVGELAALKWSCIDDKHIHIDFSEHRYDYRDRTSELVISEPKNGKHRLIPVNEEIRMLLKKIMSALPADVPVGIGDADFVFVRSDGTRYTGHDISCATNRRAAEAGISKTSIHEIRRTVSSMLRTVLPAKAVANILGHLEQTNERCYNYDTTVDHEKRVAMSEVSSKVIKN